MNHSAMETGSPFLASELERRRDVYRSLGAIFRGPLYPSADDVAVVLRGLANCGQLDEAVVSALEAVAAQASVELQETAPRAGLIQEHERLFGAREFSPLRCALSPCEVIYVAESEVEHVRMLLREYRSAGYDHRSDISGHCECVGHIAVELAFVSHVLSKATAGNPDAQRVADEFIANHLLAWGPMFAVALERHASHPVMVFAAASTQNLLACEVRRHRVSTAQVAH